MGTRRIELRARPPFRLDLTVWALRRRPHNTVDAWDGTTYRRTLQLGGGPLVVAVEQVAGEPSRRPRLSVELRRRGAEPSAADADEAGRLLDRTLGLRVDLAGFYDLARRDPRLDALARRFSGVRPPRFPTVFEAVVNAVCCQQLSLTVGIHLLDRLAATFGPTAGGRGAVAGFPTPERLAGARPSDLRGLGLSLAKARTLTLLADRVASGALDLDRLERSSDDDVRTELMALPGIGRWSAEYVLLRGLGRLQVLPGDDVGARNNLRRRFDLPAGVGYDAVSALGRTWWPYGGMVYFHLLLDGLAAAGHLPAAADGAGVRGGR